MGTWDPVFDDDLRAGIEHADYQVAVEADQINLEAREGGDRAGARGGT